MSKAPEDHSKIKIFWSKINILNVYSGLIGIFIGIVGTIMTYQQLNISRQQHAVDLAEIKKTELLHRKTESKYFIPATNQEVEKKLAKEDIADCWTSSLSSSRNDAYRCSVGNLIHDPCYVQESYSKSNFGENDIITCPASDPNNRELILVYEALIKDRNIVSLDDKKDFYWLIKLENGLYCRAYTGATGSFAGFGVSRGCTDGETFKGLVLDDIETNSAQQSTILFYSESAHTLERLFVEELWQ